MLWASSPASGTCSPPLWLRLHRGLHRTRHGNLRTDGIAAVLDRALARGREADDVLWFGPGPHPGPAELAARYGDATSLRVHPGEESVRYLWLDRARQYRG